ncbi:13880_t:CDS:2 [Entrophospora sp. SA101]|nr:13880_t:CDS:2 [Entrophospora sp. SA101]
MSRFFKDSEDSESEDDDIISDDDHISSDDENVSDEEGERKPIAQANKNRFLIGGALSSESEEEDVKREVKSARDKRLDAVGLCVKNIENAEKINDWVVIQTVPKLYIKTITQLEEFLNESIQKDKEAKKKMSATTARALNTMKHKIKKNNRQYEAEIEKFKKKTKVLEFTSEDLYRKLLEVMEARGKKNTDRLEQIKILQSLLEVASTPYQQIRVLLALIPAQFDYSPKINQLLAILENNPHFIIHEVVDDQEEDKEPVVEPGQTFGIRGSILSFIDRLDDEFTKSLQNIDPHTTDYVDRLKDETFLYSTIVRGQLYFEKHNLADNISRPDQVIQTVENTVNQQIPSGISSTIIPPHLTQDSSDLIHALCVYLYKNGESLLRTRAMLCHIYHHALHNRFYTARDMLLMSHLQDTIHQSDVGTQILHNRTMVQVGLCAFREGMIKEAQSCLMEICGSGRVKELLAQGLQLQKYALPPEQEKLDKQRQLPFHMHINFELLECVYLTCSMLLEIPSMAAADSNPEARKKIISKPFRKLLEYSEKQVFSGPAENTRDHIMGAAKALAVGEWQRSQELIGAIKIWDLMPEKKKIIEMLNHKIQEEGLRTYLFTYSTYYANLGLEQLSNMFSLPVNNVTSIVSKMIWNEELAASLDQVENAIVLHRVEPTKVQQLALMLAEKVVTFVEANEKLLEQKQTTGNQRDQPRQRGKKNFHIPFKSNRTKLSQQN